jgi:hypothetical protein
MKDEVLQVLGEHAGEFMAVIRSAMPSVDTAARRNSRSKCG